MSLGETGHKQCAACATGSRSARIIFLYFAPLKSFERFFHCILRRFLIYIYIINSYNQPPRRNEAWSCTSAWTKTVTRPQLTTQERHECGLPTAIPGHDLATIGINNGIKHMNQTRYQSYLRPSPPRELFLMVFDGFCDSPNPQKSWCAMILNILQPTLLSSYIKPCAHGTLLPQIATRELKLSFPQQSCSRYSSRLDVWCGSLKSTTRFTTYLWPKISLRYAIQWAKWWSTTVLMIQFWDKPELFQARSAGKKWYNIIPSKCMGFRFLYMFPSTNNNSGIRYSHCLTSDIFWPGLILRIAEGDMPRRKAMQVRFCLHNSSLAQKKHLYQWNEDSNHWVPLKNSLIIPPP